MSFKSPQRMHIADRVRRELMYGLSPIPTMDFDLNMLTWTSRMAVRTGPNGTFAGAPIVQGALDGTGVSDILSAFSMTLIGNPTQQTFYELEDGNQGTLVLWLTPEWDGDDGLRHEILDTGNFYFYKETSNFLFVNFYDGGAWTTLTVNTAAWTAGTTYFLAMRWDCDNTLDRTNYACISVNNAHTYGITSALTPMPMAFSLGIGHQSAANGADAVIEGLTMYRRVLTANDGTGVGCNFNASGILDELTAIYAAGAGVDPCTVTGSWDVVFCLPTNSTVGQLTTTGQAWSQPHSSSLIEASQDMSYCWDGFYGGGNWMVYFDGTGDEVNFGSDASIDNIPNGNSITVEGVWRVDALTATHSVLIGKADGQTTGWWMFISASDQLNVRVDCDTTLGVSVISASAVKLSTFADGKCHHVCFVYDDAGDKTIYIAVDGVWASAYTSQTPAVGAYTGDAAYPLCTGELNLANYDFQGAHGWLHLNNARMYTPGTNFIPPKVLATDVNTIEAWTVNQGTGNLTASVTSPNNDGIRAGATWIAAWNQHGTPVVPQSLEFFQENDGIDFGSGANIDNLFNADCTIEFYAKFPNPPTATTFPISKCPVNRTTGWYAGTYTDPHRVYFLANFANNDVALTIQGIGDDRWHHFAYDWNVGTLTLRAFMDGVYVATDTGAGAYTGDGADDLLINAVGAIGTNDGPFAIGPIRISNVRRYTGNSFVPPPRIDIASVWTLPDANTVLQIEMTDGAGTTATDTSASGYNGTITFGADTKWHNTSDLSIDEPGRLKFGLNGLNIGSDAANDGIHIYSEMIDASDYVIRPIVEYPNSSRGQARITIYDVIGGVPLVQFTGPNLTGVHDGGNNSPTFTDTGNFYPASLVGGEIYNVTDGSSGTITAVGGTNQDTITAALAGGTDNDWDNGDVSMIKPPDGWVWAEPIALTTGVNADIQVWLTNVSGEGVLTLHQVEVYDNELPHGDHEAGAGNPFVLTGWGDNLDAGDTEAEAVVLHTGSQSVEWNPAAINQGMSVVVNGVGSGTFFALGGWEYGDENGYLYIGPSGANGLMQYSLTDRYVVFDNDNVWKHNAAVLRSLATNPTIGLLASSGAVGDRWSDDTYMIILDPVTLTVTPRTYANSLEIIDGVQGIDVDGEDDCTQPVVNIAAGRGRIRFRVLFRHDPADWFSFGQALCPIIYQWENANNYIALAIDGADSMQLFYNAQGAGIVAGGWTPTGLAANTWYLFEIIYTDAYCRLRVDGVVRINLAGFAFAANPTVAVDWGNRYDSFFALDGLLASP